MPGDEPARGPEVAIARVLDSSREAIGLAFVVGRRQLLTCAHVVNDALGRDHREVADPGPAAEIWLSFPLAGDSGDELVRQARVIGWLPGSGGSFEELDGAALKLGEALPADVPLLELIGPTADRNGLVQMFGPVEVAQPFGHVRGTLIGARDRGRFQVDLLDGNAFRVDTGFSGGPVWQIATGQVVGLVQGRGAGSEAKDVDVFDVNLLRRIAFPAAPVVAPRPPPPAETPDTPTLTVLHLGNLRFGAAGRGQPSPTTGPVAKLSKDLAELRAAHGLAPTLAIVAGDLTNVGLPTEYEAAHHFLTDLAMELRLEPSRIVVVPGGRDVNRLKCEGYWKDVMGDGEVPAPPYWPKWGPYAEIATRFAATPFTEQEPWSYREFPDLRVVVAGLNSTIAMSHRDGDDYGFLGEAQLRWFAEKLDARRYGWLSIGVINHSPAGAADEVGRLRDADQFAERLARRFHMAMHGHPHTDRVHQIGTGALPVLALGGDSAEEGAEGPRLYQVIEVYRQKLRVWSRRYADDEGEWVGDTSISPAGDRCWRDLDVNLAGADAIFEVTTAAGQEAHIDVSPAPAQAGSGILLSITRSMPYATKQHFGTETLEFRFPSVAEAVEFHRRSGRPWEPEGGDDG